jgi:hypothetical protein
MTPPVESNSKDAAFPVAGLNAAGSAAIPLPAIPLPPIPLPQVVLNDLPCRTCGYNLRTLSVEKICPECATPVAASLKGDLLSGCDPDWLAELGRGGRLLIVSYILSWVMYGYGMGMVPRTGIQLIVTAAIFLLRLAGVWMLTLPDPSGLGEIQYGRPRTIARWLVVAEIVAKGLTMMGMKMMVDPNVYELLLLGHAVAQFCGIAATMFLLVYLSRLALRIPNPALQSNARRVAIAVGIVGAIGVIFSEVILPLATVPMVRFQLRTVSSLVNIGQLICVVILIQTIDKFATAFKHAVTPVMSADPFRKTN